MKLALESADLLSVKEAMKARIAEGLAADGHQIRALPAHLPPPPEKLEGRALVLDTGGTNMRAAIVELGPNGQAKVTSGPISRILPVRAHDAKLDADGFFALHAELVQQLDQAEGLAVGYCFSYPSEVLPSRDARLLHWTKGIDIPGVEGALVGARLSAALDEAGFSPRKVTVLNDTVAALLAGATRHATDRSKVIGLIVGTGTNMAGFFSAAHASKLDGIKEKMAINLESGNFHPPCLTEADEAVDHASNNPGTQRFEKAVSGHYLPQVFSQILPAHRLDPEDGAKAMVALSEANDGTTASELARSLLDRSAHLVGAALAAMVTFYEGEDEVMILAEGGLFWSSPRYSEQVKRVLDQMVTERRVRIARMENANLIGSAGAALID